jgi:hypothetical protein
MMNPGTRLLLSALAACAALPAAQVRATPAPAAPVHAADRRSVDALPGPYDWTEQKVMAVGGMANEEFGGRAVMQGNTAMLTAMLAPDDSWQGIVHVFTNVDGEWLPAQQITASDAAPHNMFGGSIAMSGDTVFIGAPEWPGVDEPDRLGAAYVFSRAGDTWIQTQKLTLADGVDLDMFGTDIAFDGSTAMIATNDGGADGVGAVHVFTRQAGIWTDVQTLRAGGPPPPGGFGSAIAVHGDTALILAMDPNPDVAEGWVYVFRRDSGGTWSQTATLTSPQVSGDYFGRSIAFTDDGTSALIGAPFATVDDNVHQGAVYVYADSDQGWAPIQTLTADDGMPGDTFGFVDVDGDSALVSAIYADGSTGAAYVFRNLGGTWVQRARLVPSDGVPLDAYGGDAVAISGTTALVGAKWASQGSDQHRGAAYFYSNETIFTGSFEAVTP